MSASGVAGATPVSLEQHYEVTTFLSLEAEILDAHRYRDWLGLLTDDIRYHMPVRVTVAHTLENSTSSMDHMEEDRFSLGKRVQRFETEHAWTEDPPSRTRRFVTNVRASLAGDAVAAKSNVLLFRSRLDVREPDFVSAERTDRLVHLDGQLKLAERLVMVDESVLRTQNLALFL
jgi:phthalate 3,4-dioxygenase subunit beta